MKIKEMSDKELLALLTELRQSKESLKKDLKTKGDIHLANIHRFFKIWVDKSHPLRQAIKNIVFGVIYGKGAKTLANDLHVEAVNNLENLVDELTKAASKSESDDYLEAREKLKEAKSKLNDERENFDHHLSTAKDIMSKMSEEWNSLYSWMEKMHDSAMENGYVEAPHGRRRHLRATLFSDKGLQAALKRRAVNAPVQGFGSDVGYMAARLIEIHMVMFLEEFDMLDYNNPVVPCGVECAVHDALYQSVPYELFLPALHIMQWCMTTGVTNLYAEKFGDKWLSPPEIESGISWSGDKESEWDYTNSSLEHAVREAIKNQYASGYGLKDVTEEEAFKMVFNIPLEQKRYLKENYAFFDDPVHLIGKL